MLPRTAFRWLVTLAVLQFTAAFAMGQQSATIQGTIRDVDFDESAAGARAEIVELGRAAEADARGGYVFSELPSGSYTLVFSGPGFSSEVVEVVLEEGQVEIVDVELANVFTEIDKFVFEPPLNFGGAGEIGLLNLRFEAPSLIDSVGSELLSQASVGSADEALGLVSGATVSADSTPVIRGLPDRYVSSQVNGVRLPSANEDKRAVELDQFPKAVIESIQVSKTFTPDQQGDASGGAVNLVLNRIPDKPIFSFNAQTSYNTQVTNEDSFLSYRGGGVGALGLEADERPIQHLGENWSGAVGVSPTSAPTDYKFSTALGGGRELDSGVEVGGFLSLFYEKDSSFFDNGIDDSWWVNSVVAPGLSPQTNQGGVNEGEFVTSLFDVTRGSRLVQWGGLASLGAEWDGHSIGLDYLYSHTAEDRATLAEDTRGKEYFFPGYDPNDPAGPGNFGNQSDAAPYLRTESLEYTERTTGTLQLSGRHELEMETVDLGDSFKLKAPILDWKLASSFADLDQPDKRLFGSLWRPPSYDPGNPTFGIPPGVNDPFFEAFKPAANFTLGNLQRIFKEIEEDSAQIQLNGELPFEQWSGDEGYLKVGYFDDQVDRTFDQESFSNFGEPFITYPGGFNEFWSSNWENENHPISQEFDLDVDYDGEFNIDAWYGMFDLPINSVVKVIGGVRLENTEIITRLAPGDDAQYFDPDGTAVSEFTPEILAEIAEPYTEDDVLPSLAMVYDVDEDWSIRAAYSQTVARPTFKELVPILQQEFLGGPVFIGNPNLELAGLTNYDLRVDYRPTAESLVSLSYFYKDIERPIEYIQRVFDFGFTTPVNYPKGTLSGFEFEVRQQLEPLWEPLEGLSVGANATLIDSSVDLPQDQIDVFSGLGVDITSRDATNAPEYLYNLYFTYQVPDTGTQMGLFYTVRGDTLVTGDSVGQISNYIPAVYQKAFGNLNFSVNQRLSQHFSLKLQAKNLTNPTIEEVYRSDFTGPDVTNTSYTRGIEYALSLSANFSF